MTASTTTSATSRSSEVAADVAVGAAGAAWDWGAAISSGKELSADPFQLLPTRIPELDGTPVQRSFHLDRDAEARLHVGRDRAKIGGAVRDAVSFRPVRPDPVLGLAHREVARDDDFQPVLLGSLGLERHQGAGMARGDDARRYRGLDRRAAAEQPHGLRDRDAMLAEPMPDLLVGQAELVDETLQAASLFDRIEVGALQVLDQAQDE